MGGAGGGWGIEYLVHWLLQEESSSTIAPRLGWTMQWSSLDTTTQVSPSAAHAVCGPLQLSPPPPGEVPYWTVRNTWGTDWGMDGYVLLKYGANICGKSKIPHCAGSPMHTHVHTYCTLSVLAQVWLTESPTRTQCPSCDVPLPLSTPLPHH